MNQYCNIEYEINKECKTLKMILSEDNISTIKKAPFYLQALIVDKVREHEDIKEGIIQNITVCNRDTQSIPLSKTPYNDFMKKYNISWIQYKIKEESFYISDCILDFETITNIARKIVNSDIVS